MNNPSEKTGGVFRTKSGGKVEISSNSHSATSSFFVDRARLGTHPEWDENEPNEWGGKGKSVERSNSIMDNVRGAMGGIGYKSSYRSVHEPAEPTCTEGPCCAPTPFGRYAKNPLTRLKGD